MTAKTIRFFLSVGCGIALLLAGAGTVAADHNATFTSHCTYEVGVGDPNWLTMEDPTGLTSDGKINFNGCNFEFLASGGSEPAPGDILVEGEYTELQVSIVDDVFGTQLGAWVGQDADDNGVNGEDEKGEISKVFCGGSSRVFVSEKDWDGDGHADFGAEMVVLTNGPFRQVYWCGSTANPVGATTGGVLNPAGGIYLSLGG